MGVTPDLRNRLQIALVSARAASELETLLGFANPAGTTYFVNADPGTPLGGSDQFDGLSPSTAFRTMGKALSVAETLDTIAFWGDVREELVGSNLVFDLTIIGLGSLHHPDQPAATYKAGSSCWRPPASPTATTPLIKVRGRGWKFINILFDCPVDSAGIYLERNALSGTSEYDAGHASIIGCDFRNGLYGIQDVGGCFNVTIRDCTFETLDATSSAAAIICTSTSVANPRRYRILDNYFQPDSSTEGNERHVIGAFVGSLLKGNTFGTVKGTGLYVDLTGGSGNVVTQNTCMGPWGTADYKGGTGDSWVGNFTAVDASTSAVGYSIAVPD